MEAGANPEKKDRRTPPLFLSDVNIFMQTTHIALLRE
jgi:hypothetical protein